MEEFIGGVKDVPFFYINCSFMTSKFIDPTIQPVDAIAEGGAVSADRLTANALRQRFAFPPEWQPEVEEEKRFVDREWQSAAVLISLIDRPKGLSLLLTQRSMRLKDHPGQISFPGGCVDEKDDTHIETALREVKEEIGIDRDRIEILGLMPEYRTGSGFKVIPVVSIVHPPFKITLNKQEVEDAFELPFSFFMNGAHYQIRSANFPNALGRRSFYTIPCNGRFVWGATAAMLRNLYRFLCA